MPERLIFKDFKRINEEKVPSLPRLCYLKGVEKL